jgi:hypothetical protein
MQPRQGFPTCIGCKRVCFVTAARVVRYALVIGFEPKTRKENNPAFPGHFALDFGLKGGRPMKPSRRQFLQGDPGSQYQA